jgi:hypothetical protein
MLQIGLICSCPPVTWHPINPFTPKDESLIIMHFITGGAAGSLTKQPDVLRVVFYSNKPPRPKAECQSKQEGGIGYAKKEKKKIHNGQSVELILPVQNFL